MSNDGDEERAAETTTLFDAVLNLQYYSILKINA